MRTNGKTRAVLSWLLTAALLAGVQPAGRGLTAGRQTAVVSEPNAVTSCTYHIDGVDVTFYLYDDQTATITDLVSGSVTTYTLPGEVDCGGETYTVTTLSLQTGTREFTALTLPEALTRLEKNAFSGCSDLETVTIKNPPYRMRIAAGAIPEGVTVIYTKWGDSISGETGAQTLQEAIDTAPNGEPTTITVTKNIGLTDVVTIPAGKQIVVNFEGTNDLTIRAEKQTLAGFFKVEEGASLTLRGEVTLDGTNLSDSVAMVDCAGTLKIEEGVTLTNGVVNNGSSGVVKVHGAKAEFTLNGGTITGNEIKRHWSGTVFVTEGAKFTLESGSIRDNKAPTAENVQATAGVFVTDGGIFMMNGGKIVENRGWRGTAVQLTSDATRGRAFFTMTDGVIGNNVGTNTSTMDSARSAGAIFVEGNVEFHMTGGEISKNDAYIGAGVCVVDSGLQRGAAEDRTTFTMDGGKITGNTAGNSGGGIYSYSNCVFLNAGEISGNEAYQGGGVYSEGNSTYYSTLYMKNALITENTAVQGGGMWFCPTGEGEICVTEGVALFDNTATGCGDDFVSTTQGKHTVTLAERMLNGGTVRWYLDGSVGSDSYGWTWVEKDLGRYGTLTGEEAEPQHIENYGGNIALKAIPEETAQAVKGATLKITGNDAIRGGGVGSNGGVVIGKTETTEVTVTKTWSGGTDRPTVTVELLNGGTVIDSVELNEKNGWTHTFKALPMGGVYTVREKAVENYTGTVSGDQKSGFIITNRYTPPKTPSPTEDEEPDYGRLTVKKTVTGHAGDPERAFTFTVTLSNTAISGQRGEMRFINGVAVFALKSGEQKTASGLPSGVKYTVTEGEANRDGYTTTASGEAGTIRTGKMAVAEFVNDKSTPNPEETPAVTPSAPPTPTPSETPTATPNPELPAVTPNPSETTLAEPEVSPEPVPAAPEPIPTAPEVSPGPASVPDDTPKTGDDLPVWLTLWCLSLAGGAVALFRKKKHE